MPPTVLRKVLRFMVVFVERYWMSNIADSTPLASREERVGVRRLPQHPPATGQPDLGAPGRSQLRSPRVKRIACWVGRPQYVPCWLVKQSFGGITLMAIWFIIPLGLIAMWLHAQTKPDVLRRIVYGSPALLTLFVVK